LRLVTPVIVNAGEGSSVDPLRRIDLKQKGADGYDERWLQSLVASNPTVLPIAEIEPAFAPAISICTELPLASGFLDNLLVTASGNLIAVECKLWRNSEARREVISQIIDYAKDIQRLSYAELEFAIGQAHKKPGFRLYDQVFRATKEEEPPLDEPRFVDAVTRNLRRGRCLLLIVGDGITEGAEAMAEFLQQHAGMRFAIALVQLTVYETPNAAQRLVVPSVPLRTTNIVRGIVQIQETGVTIIPPPDTARGERASTLTEEQFMSSLDGLRPGTSARLLEFLEGQKDLDVDYDVLKTLVVRMVVADLRVQPFWFYQNGIVDTAVAFGQKQLMRPFAEKLAAAIPGTSAKETPKTWYVPRLKSDGTKLTIWDVLDHAEGVRAAPGDSTRVVEGSCVVRLFAKSVDPSAGHPIDLLRQHGSDDFVRGIRHLRGDRPFRRHDAHLASGDPLGNCCGTPIPSSGSIVYPDTRTSDAMPPHPRSPSRPLYALP
jgi:hypothetical protein